MLAHRIGPAALQEMLGHVIRNVHCPTLLADILHRCRLSPTSQQTAGTASGATSSASCAAAAVAAGHLARYGSTVPPSIQSHLQSAAAAATIQG